MPGNFDISLAIRITTEQNLQILALQEHSPSGSKLSNEDITADSPPPVALSLVHANIWYVTAWQTIAPEPRTEHHTSRTLQTEENLMYGTYRRVRGNAAQDVDARQNTRHASKATHHKGKPIRTYVEST